MSWEAFDEARKKWGDDYRSSQRPSARAKRAATRVAKDQGKTIKSLASDDRVKAATAMAGLAAVKGAASIMGHKGDKGSVGEIAARVRDEAQKASAHYQAGGIIHTALGGMTLDQKTIDKGQSQALAAHALKSLATVADHIAKSQGAGQKVTTKAPTRNSTKTAKTSSEKMVRVVKDTSAPKTAKPRTAPAKPRTPKKKPTS